MARALVFVGGVQGTGKTEMIRFACPVQPHEWPVLYHLRISEFYRAEMRQAGIDDFEAEEWKPFEPDAIRAAGITLEELRHGPYDAVLVNTHFASPSKRGYIPGTDPKWILHLCRSFGVTRGDPDTRAGVLLIDSSLDILREPNEELQWDQTQLREVVGRVDQVMEELYQNREKSMDYYHTLTRFLDFDRVEYMTLVPNEKAPLSIREKRKYGDDIRRLVGELCGPGPAGLTSKPQAIPPG